MNAPYRAPRHGSMLLMLALLIGPLLLPSSGSVRSSRIQSAAPATANASDALTRLLPPSLQLASVDADFYERSVEAPGDAQPYASMLARVARTRRVSIGVVGGSASVRGGCPRCAPGSGLASGAAMRSCAMHGGFQDWVARWFQEELGAVATVHDGGQSGSGPAMPMLCLESLLGTSAAVGDGLDLLLVEFAVNAAPRCDVSGAELERLLWRLRDYAPSAAILLVHTYALRSYLDAAACFVPLAHHYGIGSVSWRQAVAPLHHAKTLPTQSTHEPPTGIHPNCEGHRQIGSLIARFLLGARQRAVATPTPPRLRLRCGSDGADAPAPLYSKYLPSMHRDGLGCGASSEAPAGSRRRSAADGAPSRSPPHLPPRCVGARSLRPAVSDGWWRHGRWWACATPNATLRLPFECARDGCGVALGHSTSTLPLGQARLLVDGQGALTLSGANPELRASSHQMTIQRLTVVTPPCADGAKARRRSAPCGLARGAHTLDVVCTGGTSDAAREWPVQHYHPHEFHVRTLVVSEEPMSRANKAGDVINIGGHEQGARGGTTLPSF